MIQKLLRYLAFWITLILKANMMQWIELGWVERIQVIDGPVWLYLYLGFWNRKIESALVTLCHSCHRLALTKPSKT
jgi:hypothetical protein